MDETGIALGVCVNQTVVGSSSTTRSYKKSPENREWVSIIEAASAIGSRTRCLGDSLRGWFVTHSWYKYERWHVRKTSKWVLYNAHWAHLWEILRHGTTDEASRRPL